MKRPRMEPCDDAAERCCRAAARLFAPGVRGRGQHRCQLSHHCQKRPILVSKETYSSVKRDLF